MNKAEHMNAPGEAADHAGGDHDAHEYVQRVDSYGATKARAEPDEARAKPLHGEPAPEAVDSHQRKTENEAEMQCRGWQQSR